LRASVIVPTFNRANLLRDLLDSLVCQTLSSGEFEIVLSDDGSGGEVLALQAEYAKTFPRLRFVTGPNGGPGIARNRGVIAAEADILLFVDSDCLVEAGWLEALTTAVEKGAPLVFGPTRSAVPPLEPFVHSIISESQLTACTNVGVRRSTFNELGGFRPEISRIAEDRDFAARAIARGIVALRVPNAVVIHPPRLKRIRAPLSRIDYLTLRELRTFYLKNPAFRSNAVSTNRSLVLKGSAKLLIVAVPAICAALFSVAVIAPVGFLAMIAQAIAKRRRINRHLVRLNVPLQVALASALKYGALQPVMDLLSFAQRFRCGMGWLW
jgi:glycosyltransferase involved in cell wall biosynthesis